MMSSLTQCVKRNVGTDVESKQICEIARSSSKNLLTAMARALRLAMKFSEPSMTCSLCMERFERLTRCADAESAWIITRSRSAYVPLCGLGTSCKIRVQGSRPMTASCFRDRHILNRR